MAYGPMYGATKMAVQDKYKKQQPQQQAAPGVGAGAPQQQPAIGGQVQPPERKGSYVKEQKPPVAFQQPQQAAPQIQPSAPMGAPGQVMDLDWPGGDLPPSIENNPDEFPWAEPPVSESGQDIRAMGMMPHEEKPFDPLEKAPQEPGYTPDLELSREDIWRRKGYDPDIGSAMDRVFGDEASFDPQQELLEEQRDKAMRQSMERMAAQGMLGTGAAGGAAQDIMRGAARDIAQARQEWHQQQVQNGLQAAQMLFQDEWKHLGFEQQKALAELMFDLDRKRKFGDRWESGMGDYDMEIIMDMLASGNLSPEAKEMLEDLLGDLYGEDRTGGWEEKGDEANKAKAEAEALAMQRMKQAESGGGIYF